MFKFFKNTLLLLLFINLAACSYSPSSLKDSYDSLATEFSEQLKEPLKPTAQQSAMIDDYAKQLLQWHRRNKLPEYSNTLAKLAEIVTQKNVSLPQLQTILSYVDDAPHFEQASHLTYKMQAVAGTLSNKQITQLERSFNKEHQADLLDSKRESHTEEAREMIHLMFKFIGINLNSEQLKLAKEKALKLHDIRPYELANQKKWNQQMIALLRHKQSSNFSTRFPQLWNAQEVKLTGKAKQLEQQNNRLIATLTRELIMRFNPQQKDKLSRKLISMSNTFSEMANQ